MAAAFFGKYRGTVLRTDPEGRGRLILQIPSVLGVTPSTWTEACVPARAPTDPRPVLPDIGTEVWVEFENGDPDRPIWSGCPWPDPDAAAPDADGRIVTRLGAGVTLTQAADGRLTLATPTGVSIEIGPGQILLNNGQGASITLIGPTVSINVGALTVT